MPPKYSRRPVKKLSEFKKLQLELNPSQARDVGGKSLKPCLPECNHSSSNCKHSDLPKAPINMSPRDREDEIDAKYTFLLLFEINQVFFYQYYPC